jgi:cardiolipin synthase
VSEWSHSILHAKAAAIDGRRLLVGSFNLDPLSLANLEAIAEVADPSTAAAGASWIRARFEEGVEITAEGLGRAPAFERFLMDRVGWLFSRAIRRIGRRLSRG